MRRVMVKLCGLSEEEHAVTAAEAGADYLGFVFAPSRRRVSPAVAARLCGVVSRMPRRPLLVGVFVDESPDVVNAIARDCGLDAVQLSGEETATYASRIDYPVIRTIGVARGTTAGEVIAFAESYRQQADREVGFLLDAASRTARGGTGVVFDWEVARQVSVRCPIMVAGGLTPANVGDLVRCVAPWGVDVSSGVEQGGRKHPVLIQAFVAAVRAAEKEMYHADTAASG
jgi:phosphoribosylanthranilate isomerase